MIPRIDAAALTDKTHKDHEAAKSAARKAAHEVGFMTIYNTPISAATVTDLIETYRDFFKQPNEVKDAINMARTGANRGWGAPGSEQVDPNANPDYKQVFDCGFQLSEDNPLTKISFYAPNLWPDLKGFRDTVSAYYAEATGFALVLLRAIAGAIGEPEDFFDDKFNRPMALLRGNFYPERPNWAGDKDFGIAAHTDYGCLTLLATDGSPGLEVQERDGSWTAVSAPVGEFVINFGEMLEMWTSGRVVATPHRVKGSAHERISIPLFFNPNHDTNVAPIGSDKTIPAGEHLARRFDETYVHLRDKA